MSAIGIKERYAPGLGGMAAYAYTYAQARAGKMARLLKHCWINGIKPRI
jgi:hypothetical protein